MAYNCARLYSLLLLFVWVTLVIMTLELTPTWAVDESKFMKCVDAPHCRRYQQFVTFRQEVENTHNLFVVVPESIELPDPQKNNNVAKFRLKNTVEDSFLEARLQLITPLGIVHLTIDELNSTVSQKRYKVPKDEVLQDSVLEKLALSSNIRKSTVNIKQDNFMSLESKLENGETLYIKLKFKPFGLYFYVDNILLQSINGRQLMNFERYRQRPSSLDNNNYTEAPSSPSALNVDVVEKDGTADMTNIIPIEEQEQEHLLNTEESIDDENNDDIRKRHFEQGGTYMNDDNQQHKNGFDQKKRKLDPEFIADAVALDNIGAWSSSFANEIDEKPFGPTAIGIDIEFLNAIHLFGLPSHSTSLSLPAYDTPYRSWNLDVFEYELNSPMALYGSVPIIWALHHYYNKTLMSGLLWVNPSETWIKLSKENTQEDHHYNTWFLSETGILDIVFFAGPQPQNVLTQYHVVTGLPSVPPLFSLGKHQCRWNYMDEQDIEDVDEGFDQHEIPYDVIWLDIEHTDSRKYFMWNPKTFPTPEKMLKKLEKKGRKLVAIVDPHIKQDDSYTVYKELKDKGALLKTSAHQDFSGWCWPGASVYPDFLNSEVRKTFGKFYLPNFWKGSSNTLFVWNDMNEPSVFNKPEITCPRTVLHLDNREHREVHNLYGLYFHRTTYEALRQRDKNQRPFILSRSFFIGSHRYGAIWTGDNMARWDHLKASIPMLLNHALGGISFIGADVGGFFGEPSPELLTRWAQQGAWYPFFRYHSHIETKRREPWLFETEVLERLRKAAQLRYRVLPMWYTLFMENALFAHPIIRPIWWDSKNLSYLKSNALDIFDYQDEEFMVGDAILIKAITTPEIQLLSPNTSAHNEKKATTVNVYLPRNIPEKKSESRFAQWYCFHSGQAIHSRSSNIIQSLVTQDAIPIYVKAGSILFQKNRQRRSSYIQLKDKFDIHIYPNWLNKDIIAKGRIYVDDGSSYDYLNSQQFVYDEFLFSSSNNNELILTNKPLPISTSLNIPPSLYGKTKTLPSQSINLAINEIVIWGLTNDVDKVFIITEDGNEEILKFYTYIQNDGERYLRIKQPSIQLGLYNSTLKIKIIH